MTTQSLRLALLRFYFSILSRIAPDPAARLALRLFLTPTRHARPEWEEVLLRTGMPLRVQVGDKALQAQVWGHGPTILLAHGWSGRGSQLGMFIPSLVAAGYRVVTFDGPAHADSPGQETDMIEFSAALAAVANTQSPLHAVIAHSFGAACTLLAVKRKLIAPERMILIGSPASAIWVTETFGAQLHIPARIVANMRERLRARYERRWTWEEMAMEDLIGHVPCPLLLVHDVDDKEVPYAHALRLQAACGRRLLTTRGLGHRRILRDPAVVRRVRAFIEGKGIGDDMMGEKTPESRERLTA